MWAARLGSFLVERVMKVGKDARFDKAKHDPAKFLIFWSLQGLWVFVTLLPTLALHSSNLNPAFGLKDFIGFGIWERFPSSLVSPLRNNYTKIHNTFAKWK